MTRILLGDGEEAIFDTQRLMNARPASAAARYEGTAADGIESTLKLPGSTFRLLINSMTRS